MNEREEKLLFDRLDIQQRLIESQRRVIEEYRTLLELMKDEKEQSRKA